MLVWPRWAPFGQKKFLSLMRDIYTLPSSIAPVILHLSTKYLFFGLESDTHLFMVSCLRLFLHSSLIKIHVL